MRCREPRIPQARVGIAGELPRPRQIPHGANGGTFGDAGFGQHIVKVTGPPMPEVLPHGGDLVSYVRIRGCHRIEAQAASSRRR